MQKKIKNIILFLVIAAILLVTGLVFAISIKNKNNTQYLNNLPDDEIVEIVTRAEDEMIDGGEGDEVVVEKDKMVTDEFQITDDLKKVMQDVPFTSQAPQAQWSIEMFQDACEEASVIMAMKWARGDMNLTPIEARDKIIEISNFEQEHYGFHLDVSIRDVEKVFYDYYNYRNIKLKEVRKKEDLIEPLYDDAVVIIPTNGKALNNPNFSDGGPDRHMLVIIGYDPVKKEFITNEPGTRKGNSYRYKDDVIFNAVRNYTSGYHAPIVGNEKLMIVVNK